MFVLCVFEFTALNIYIWPDMRLVLAVVDRLELADKNTMTSFCRSLYEH